MQATKEDMMRDWEAWRGGARLHDSMTFTRAGLVLGCGTILVAFEEDEQGRNPVDGNESRILALLAGAFGRPVGGGVIEKMRRASALWRAGDKSLAQIYLALTGLPRIGEWDAYRLHLTKKLLTRGLSPGDVLKIMGFQQEARELEKKYNQNQPRVPAGSGAESGRWTSGGGGGAGQRIVRRVDVNVIGARRSDASRSGAQYAQANPAPVISAQDMKHIRELHDFGTPNERKGKFRPEYSNDEAIRQLVEDAWKHATAEDLGAGNDGTGTVVIAASVSMLENGVLRPSIIGVSGRLRTPSIPTNAYVVVIDSNNNVKTCYPINPADPINPREE
jgi:hypothetical protein